MLLAQGRKRRGGRSLRSGDEPVQYWTSSQERARWMRRRRQITASKRYRGCGNMGWGIRGKAQVPNLVKRGVQIEVREGVCSLGLSKQSPEIINQMRGLSRKGEPGGAASQAAGKPYRDPFSCPKTALICYQKQVGAEDTWICNQPDIVPTRPEL